jgi:tetratricopeptide (TPR) repeat protein
MKSFLTTLMGLCMAATVCGQYITKHDVDSLRKSINRGKKEILVINSMTQLAIYYTLKQGANKTDLDSAAQLINRAISLTRQKNMPAINARIGLAESYYYRVSGHADQGKKSIDSALAIAKTEADKSLLGEVYFEMSNYYNYDFTSKTIKQRLKFIELAVPCFQESSNIEQLAYCYKIIADLHHLINEYEKAFDEVKLSIKLYQSINYPELQGPYTLISKLYYARGDYKQSLSYGLAALKIAEFNGDTTMQLCEIDNNLGYTFYKLNDIDNALKYFIKSIEIAERAKDNRTVYMLTSNIVETYIK